MALVDVSSRPSGPLQHITPGRETAEPMARQGRLDYVYGSLAIGGVLFVGGMITLGWMAARRTDMLLVSRLDDLRKMVSSAQFKAHLIAGEHLRRRRDDLN